MIDRRPFDRYTPPEKSSKIPPQISHHSHSLVDIMVEQRNGEESIADPMPPAIPTNSPDCWVAAASIKRPAPLNTPPNVAAAIAIAAGVIERTNIPQLMSLQIRIQDTQSDNGAQPMSTTPPEEIVVTPPVVKTPLVVKPPLLGTVELVSAKMSRSNSESSDCTVDKETDIRSAMLLYENIIPDDPKTDTSDTDTGAKSPVRFVEPIDLYTADINDLIKTNNYLKSSSLSFFTHTFDSNVSKHSAGSTDNVTSSSSSSSSIEGSYASISPSEDHQPLILAGMPSVSHNTDWTAAFGFKGVQCKDDDLGFDPWNESNKALTDLIRGESLNRSANSAIAALNPLTMQRTNLRCNDSTTAPPPGLGQQGHQRKQTANRR